MHRFAGIFRHELGMSLRRKGLWLAYGLLFFFFTLLLFAPPPFGQSLRWRVTSSQDLWPTAGRLLVILNAFFPVVAGILSADRVQRDFRLGLRELQDSTPLSRPVYVLAKYAAALASMLLPIFLWAMAVAVAMTAGGRAPLGFLAAVPVAFLAIAVPAFAFVIAFSLACPLVMPLSVYQILFTGYWYWANYVPPKLLPTLNGTLLTPGGMIAWQGFFGGPSLPAAGAAHGHGRGAAEAGMNLAVLLLCSAAVLTLLERYLRRQALRA